jgi:hypothetical protein
LRKIFDAQETFKVKGYRPTEMIKNYRESRLIKIAFVVGVICLTVYIIPFVVLSFLSETKDYKKYFMPVEFPDFFVLISHAEQGYLSR